ncbi:MAG: hypothetical protein E6R00_06890 [Gammaproteobacteria bacterium]|jgi:hypothetical protein|nr:MAG: hypothetical protein E6R00_06890 [Gammaproteobacteria bacterium]
MTTKEFSVSSSDGSSAYTVVVKWNGHELFVACDCKAGSIGDWCRHKNGLLNGEEAILAVKDNLTDVLQWVNASPVHAAMSDIHIAESQQKDAEVLLKKAKSKVQAAKRAAANLVNPLVKK